MTTPAKAALYLLSFALAASTTLLGVRPKEAPARPGSEPGGSGLPPAARTVATSAMGQVRVPFVENTGQLAGPVRYYAPTFGGTVFVTTSGDIVYALPKEGGGESATLTERLVGARPLAVAGMDQSATRVSYLVGNDLNRHRSGLKTFNTVSLGPVYSGIELRLSAHGNTVEKLFYVDPGADPSNIRIALSGASNLAVTAKGELQAQTALGAVTFSAPVAFQEREGRRVEVPVSYAMGRDGYGFSLGAYDQSLPLVIDPTLASTFIGGGGGQSVATLAFGSGGTVYVAGTTNAADFPLAASYKGGANDVFVLRLDADLTTVETAAYVGGSLDDVWGGLGIDSVGNVFISGRTVSTNIPVTTGASYDPTFNGGTDLFVAKLNSDLTAVLAATYLGGSGNEFWCCGSSLRIDGDDNVFTVILTNSTNYPTTAGVWDTTYNDGSHNTDDLVISKLSNDLDTLMASTYLGGALWDVPTGSTMDGDGNIYVVGRTSSGNNGYGASFPTTPGAYHGDYADGWVGNDAFFDGFIAKLDNDLHLVASTYLGTTSPFDVIWDIAVAQDFSVYVVGSTKSNAFPGVAGHYDATYNDSGGEDGFVAHLNAGLTTLLGATYLGGPGFDRAAGISLDAVGNVHVGGVTNSSTFPTTSEAFQPAYHPGGVSGYDGIYARLSGDLVSLQYSTFVGATGDDGVGRPMLSPERGVYLYGYTTSSDFPTSSGAADTTYGGNTDGFVMRLPTRDVALAKTASPASAAVGSHVTYTLTATNSGPGTATGIVVVDTLPAGVSLVSATPSQGPPCTGTTTITCALGSVAESESATVTIVVIANAIGNVTNTAAFSAGYFDAVPANNQASVSVGVLPDQDGDLIADSEDNCPAQPNPNQEDVDGDHIGDACDPNNNDGPWGDLDGDGIPNDLDPDDNDGPTGDLDGDGALNATDNCPTVANPDQADTDQDGIGNACDPTPNGDTDNDGIDNLADNCPTVANPDQANYDGDPMGDACDPDDDNDGVPDASDAFPLNPAESIDTDGDGIGNNADLDDDGDGDPDVTDCAALNPAVHHGAAEIPGNSVDDNCNGQTDETEAQLLFGGMQAPYAPPPTSFRVGRAIPLKWQYTNAAGVPVDSAAASPTVQYAPSPCGADAGETTLDVDSPGNSGLQYDPLTHTWKLNWKTTGIPVGCYLLIVTSPIAQSSLVLPIQFK